MTVARRTARQRLIVVVIIDGRRGVGVSLAGHPIECIVVDRGRDAARVGLARQIAVVVILIVDRPAFRIGC